MIIDLGHFCLALALSVAILQFILPIIGIRLKSNRCLNTSIYSSYIFFFLVLLSFSALAWAYISSDFSLMLVAQNSHSQKPLIYKIAGVWSNHEGSLLLWILIMSSYTFIFSYEKRIDSILKCWTIFFQIIIHTGSKITHLISSFAGKT